MTQAHGFEGGSGAARQVHGACLTANAQSAEVANCELAANRRTSLYTRACALACAGGKELYKPLSQALFANVDYMVMFYRQGLHNYTVTTSHVHLQENAAYTLALTVRASALLRAAWVR